MKRYRLPKSRILRSKKAIDELFSNGKAITCYPLKVIYLLQQIEHNDIGAAAMFVVSKKKFKRAVDRNLLKRRVREAYRLTFHEINQVCVDRKITLNMAFLYLSSQQESYDSIHKSMQTIFNGINNTITAF